MPTEARFRIEAKDRVAALWIDNPPRNLLRLSMISELPGLVEALEKDDAIRAVVVSGAGPAHFSAGVDMDDVGLRLEDQGVAGFHMSYQEVLAALTAKAARLSRR